MQAVMTFRFSTSASSSLICFLSLLRPLLLARPGCLFRRSSKAAMTSACSLMTLLFLLTKSWFSAYLQTRMPNCAVAWQVSWFVNRHLQTVDVGKMMR